MADYDVVIVGSGLAGLTAGLFAVRQGLSTLILESNVPGGHLISIEKIEDFPGFPDGIAGWISTRRCSAKQPIRAPTFSAPGFKALKRKIDSGWWSQKKNGTALKPSSSPPDRSSKT